MPLRTEQDASHVLARRSVPLYRTLHTVATRIFGLKAAPATTVRILSRGWLAKDLCRGVAFLRAEAWTKKSVFACIKPRHREGSRARKSRPRRPRMLRTPHLHRISSKPMFSGWISSYVAISGRSLLPLMKGCEPSSAQAQTERNSELKIPAPCERATTSVLRIRLRIPSACSARKPQHSCGKQNCVMFCTRRVDEQMEADMDLERLCCQRHADSHRFTSASSPTRTLGPCETLEV